MSAGSDNVFARWSRRKLAVRDSETAPPDAEEHVADAVAPEADIEPAEPIDQQLAAVELDDVQPEDAEPAEPLPRLEDLTAEGDLSAFLRKGVPKALKNAAMRKMWSLDPAIRDYIGPSEYAWDFNTPGSMAGFGPLDPDDAMVADFLSTMSGGVRAGLAKVVAAAETPRQIAAVSTDEEASPPLEGPVDAALPDESAADIEERAQSHSLDQAQAAAPAEPAEPDEPDEPENPAESSRSPAPPRHGGAMPR